MPKDPLEKMMATGERQRMTMRKKKREQRSVMVCVSAAAPAVRPGVDPVTVSVSELQQ